jgi:hypothetical protein
MTVLKLFGLAILALLALGLAIGVASSWYFHRRDTAERQEVWARLEALREAEPPRFEPAMLVGLPDLAQRWLARAIVPGAPLHRLVWLQMQGSFIMNGKSLPMVARQVLAPPAYGFVWQADIGQGLVSFAGSDGYHQPAGPADSARSWTKFWLHGLLPLARVGGNPDHAHAAATRVMLEAVWAPATMLPMHGAQWRQTGPDSAEVRFAQTPELPPMQLKFNAHGDLAEVWAMRWTDANADKVYRLQPFGGRILAMGEFQGFRVPTHVEMGNLWGTPDYTPFFLAQITAVRY